jgi:hypothetical protein
MNNFNLIMIRFEVKIISCLFDYLYVEYNFLYLITRSAIIIVEFMEREEVAILKS